MFQNSENFLCKSVIFRAIASCSKILNDEKYVFNTVKNSRATLCPNSESEKYIPYNELSGHLCFSGQAQAAQNPE